jgi:hypothetical protein
MKRLLQFVAMVVVALLIAQPALAGVSCDVGASSVAGCTPGCGMASMGQMSPSSMGANCPMSPEISSDGCAQNCCLNGLAQVVAQPVAGAKSNLAKPLQFVPVAETLAVATPEFAVSPRTQFNSSAPPRYILFQVFRV